MATRDQLRRSPFFARLPAMEVDVLAVSLPSTTYADGALIFQEGEPGDFLVLVLDGEIEVVKALGSARAMFVVAFCDRKCASSASVRMKKKSSGKRSGLRFTASLIRLGVVW